MELTAVGIAAASLVFTGYNTLVRDRIRATAQAAWQAKIEARVELLWAFLLRRGLSEAVAGGLMEKNSPLSLNMEVLSQHVGLMERAQAWYDLDGGRTLSDLELIIQLDVTFGAELSVAAARSKLPAGGFGVALAFRLRPDMALFVEFNAAHDRAHALAASAKAGG